MPNVLSRTLSSLFLPFSQDQANSVWIIGARGNIIKRTNKMDKNKVLKTSLRNRPTQYGSLELGEITRKCYKKNRHDG